MGISSLIRNVSDAMAIDNPTSLIVFGDWLSSRRPSSSGRDARDAAQTTEKISNARQNHSGPFS